MGQFPLALVDVNERVQRQLSLEKLLCHVLKAARGHLVTDSPALGGGLSLHHPWRDTPSFLPTRPLLRSSTALHSRPWLTPWAHLPTTSWTAVGWRVSASGCRGPLGLERTAPRPVPTFSLHQPEPFAPSTGCILTRGLSRTKISSCPSGFHHQSRSYNCPPGSSPGLVRLQPPVLSWLRPVGTSHLLRADGTPSAHETLTKPAQ